MTVAEPGTVVVSERIEVHGVVQGVGFRPFVHGLAVELGLSGHVGNDPVKVFVEVAGAPGAIDSFVARLETDAPRLARVDRVVRSQRQPVDAVEPGFRIVESRAATGRSTPIPPDTALCADCLAELFDPADRRYRHPFITCTNCGPRFTIITGVPYDRPATTMASFPMCGHCRAEYDDPSDRRHHAQPISCHRCGPTLSFRPTGAPPSPAPGSPPSGGDPIAEAAAALARGEILAVKGLGGYHLACDARSNAAVDELRHRKQRADKPFAVMVADLEQAESLAEIDPAEAGLLTSPAAPIVLLRARPGSPLSALVAPGNPMVGVLLAYTPIHHLLLAEHGAPLVMTSANRGGEPIASTPERLAELADLVDGVLDHDRPIHQACDDSVVRVVADRLLPVRRARGYAPLPVPFPSNGSTTSPRSVLAVGAELKNTFCVAADGLAWVSQHIGDMENLETLRAFEGSVDHYLRHYRIDPATVAADAHPGYLSSGWARRHHGPRLIEVQHHHAHVAAVMAEHQLDPTKPVIGIAFDGTGYGHDATIWGGEVLLASAADFERVAHLAPIPLPGGDAAIRQPARVALAHLWAAGIEWSSELPPVRHLVGLPDGGLALLARQLERGINCVPTTSMGRLFDGVASLVGLRHEISYEAQAAIELEIAAVDGRAIDPTGHYRFELDGPVADPGPVLAALVDDLLATTPIPVMAWRFHRAVVDLVERIAVRLRAERDVDTVALTGGVFQNALLTECCVDALEGQGFRTLTHALLPPNDGGLSLGQAYVAANRPSTEREA